MGPMMKLNMRAVTVSKVGTFEGCPRADRRVATR